MDSNDGEQRNQAIFASVTPTLKDRLDTYARRNHWTRSTAAAVLIERGLDAADQAREGGHDGTA
jgi:hypothetical protein